MILAALFFQACQGVIEEKILSNQKLDPLYVVGYEGLWGLIFTSVVLPIF